MHVLDVLEKCKEKGYPITRCGLYRVGYKYGFLKKVEGQKNLEFNRYRFFKWLDSALSKAPEGYVRVSDLCKIFDISLPQAYILVRDKDSGATKYGSGKGILYVNPERIRKIIERNKLSRKERWDD